MIDLSQLDNTEADRLIQAGAPVCLSINPVEYHGPHLSIHNDGIISRALLADMHRLVHARHPEWPFLFAGEIEAGAETTPGPGSVSTPYPELKRRTLAECRALAERGAKRVVLMTFHGSPLHNAAIWHGVRYLERRQVRAIAPLNLLTQRILEPEGIRYPEIYAPVADPECRRKLIKESNQDFHAGFGETSLCLHYAPETVRDHAQVPPCPDLAPTRTFRRLARAASVFGAKQLALELLFLGRAVSWAGTRPFPGYSGHPAPANAESGAILAGLVADVFAEEAVRVFDGQARPPKPVAAWLTTLTLGGRVLKLGSFSDGTKRK